MEIEPVSPEPSEEACAGAAFRHRRSSEFCQRLVCPAKSSSSQCMDRKQLRSHV